MGFYETWALTFNIVIAIDVAVFLAPVILDIVPAAGETSYANALALAATAVGTFLLLHGITYILFTSQFRIPLPKLFDVLFAGLLGFLAGFLVSSFAAVIVAAMPISRNQFLSDMGLNVESQQANISYISWWCDVVNFVASSPDNKITGRQAILQLLEVTKPEHQNDTPKRIDPNEPIQPRDIKTDVRVEKQPSPS
jgi:hypothetical protein